MTPSTRPGASFKEIWGERHRLRLDVPVIMGVGGSFGLLAGFVSRAPRWLQAMASEWFGPLLMEARKLWKRYLTTDMEFIWLAGREIVVRRRRRSPTASDPNGGEHGDHRTHHRGRCHPHALEGGVTPAGIGVGI